MAALEVGARSVLFAAGLAQAIAAGCTFAAHHVASNTVGACVCLTAGLHYVDMKGRPVRERILIRFSDWYITTSLLILKFFIAFDVLSERWVLLLVCLALNAGCLFLGSLAEQNRSSGDDAVFVRMFCAACVCSAVFFVVFLFATYEAEEERYWLFAFLAPWFGYPLAFLSSADSPALTLLDVVSKAVFGLTYALYSILA